MRKALPYRPVAVLALLALVLSAFAPASVPCTLDEAPAPMPCHESVAGGATDGDTPPHGPEPPAAPRPDAVMTCCNGGAALTAPSVRAEADLSLAVATALAAAALPAPAARPHLVQATDASPPTPARLHLLFGCFLT